MFAAFAALLAGWLLLTSGRDNVSVAELMRGVIGSPDAGPGPRGFAAAIIGETVGNRMASASAPASVAGLVTFDGQKVCGWVATELRKARARGWSGSLISGHRDIAEQRAACVSVCGNPNGCGSGCAKPGESNHQGTAYPECAADVSDPAGLARALPAGSPLKWTGRTIGDTPHFSSGRRGV